MAGEDKTRGTDNDGPNPDALLAALQRDEAKQGRGKLKVSLGMCAGLGKTFAMLEAARREQANGRDVVVGYLEIDKGRAGRRIEPPDDPVPLRACLKNGFASDAQAGGNLARRDERAYWKQSVIKEQRSQVDARPEDEANALFNQALTGFDGASRESVTC